MGFGSPCRAKFCSLSLARVDGLSAWGEPWQVEHRILSFLCDMLFRKEPPKVWVSTPFSPVALWQFGDDLTLVAISGTAGLVRLDAPVGEVLHTIS